MDEPGIADTATSFGVPLRFFGPDTLEAETPRLANPSEVVFREVGAHGVAEAAALAAAGAESTLIAPKVKSLRATCAVARADSPIEGHLGTERGHLALIGLGPGQEAWRSGEAAQQLRDAEDIVGFKAYFDLIEDMPLSGDIHAFEIGAERDRVRKAFDLAATGRRVALICSGDAGIYAMAALAFEMLDETTRSDWRRISIEVAPGISALQAAAARIGAPLGHDFCTISLSDLLTPWSIIEKRIRAAAEGDFVVAFQSRLQASRHSASSRTRYSALASPEISPVVLARNLGRPDEAVRVISLDELSTDGVDMTTLVSGRLVRDPSDRPRVRRRLGVHTPRLCGQASRRNRRMTVYFIGAGPGAADLITVRGQRLISACPVCLYAGSLVPTEIIEAAPRDATVIDTASLTLDEIIDHIATADAAGHHVARVHSGDPSIYGAIGEQMSRLEALGIPYEIVPGVPAFAAAAAALQTELTLPDMSQAVILTRTARKSAAMPEGEDLATLAQSRATLAIHLSIRNIRAVVEALSPAYGEDCPSLLSIVQHGQTS